MSERHGGERGSCRPAAYGSAYDGLFRLREELGDEELDRRLRLLREETLELARHLDAPLAGEPEPVGLLQRVREWLRDVVAGTHRGGVRHRVWAGGVGTLLVLFILAAVNQAGTDIAEVSFVVEGKAAVGQMPRILVVGEQATITYRFEGVDREGNPCSESRTLRVNPDGTIAGRIRVPAGGVTHAEVTIRNGYIEVDGRKVNHFTGATSLHAGRTLVSIGDKGSWSASRSAALRDVISTPDGVSRVLNQPSDYFDEMVAREDAAASAANRFRTAAINFFDDVRVTSGDRVFLDESFDDTPSRGFPASLINIWPGKAGFVIPDTSAPSLPNAFMSQALRNDNRHDGIRITPSDVPSGRLTIELSCKVSDVRKGVSFGLKQIRGEYAGEPASLNMDEGVVYPSSGLTRLATFEARRWYRIRLDVDLNAHTMDVWMDGRRIGQGIPLAEDPAAPYSFDHFTFGGVNFLHKK